MPIKYLSGNVKETSIYKHGFRIGIWVLDRNLKIIKILMLSKATTLELNCLESDYKGKKWSWENREKKEKDFKREPSDKPGYKIANRKLSSKGGLEAHVQDLSRLSKWHGVPEGKRGECFRKAWSAGWMLLRGYYGIIANLDNFYFSEFWV